MNLSIDTAKVEYVSILSFPKSGNTWLRYILSHLLFNGDLACIPDKYIGGVLRAPVVHDAQGNHVRLYKSHDASFDGNRGTSLLPHKFIIHLVRHPLDVFLSFLNYLLIEKGAKVYPFDLPIRSVEDAVANDQIEDLLSAFLVFGSMNPAFAAARGWQRHTDYWLNRAPVETPVITIRYEDMISAGPESLNEIAEYFGKSIAEVQCAFKKADSNTRRDGGFYWRRRVGNYRSVLTLKQIEKAARILGEGPAASLGYDF